MSLLLILGIFAGGFFLGFFTAAGFAGRRVRELESTLYLLRPATGRQG